MPPPSRNPFAPPRAELAELPDSRPGSLIKAVLLGLAVDLGGSMLAAILFGIVYGISVAESGMTPDELAAATSQIPADSWVFIAGTSAGLAFSILGGYVCARIARQSEYRSGAILAALSSLTGLLVGAGHYAPAVNGLLVVATFACVLLGARLARARNRRP